MQPIMYLLIYNEANNGKIRDEPNQKSRINKPLHSHIYAFPKQDF